MPVVDDYSQDDDEEKAPHTSSGGGGTVFAQRQAQPESGGGYVPWGRFASANADVSQREAGKLSGRVKSDAEKAQGELSSAQQSFSQGVEQNYQKPKQDESIAAPVDESAPRAGAPLPAGADAQISAKPSAATGNPWASFDIGQSSDVPGQIQAKPRGEPTAASIRPSTLTADAAAGNPAGAKDLEAAAGQQAWSQLLGDSLRATQEAGALGSEGGVQAMLEKSGQPMPNSAFDATLINGAGREDFGKLNKEYGGGELLKDVAGAEQASQDRWKMLQGDVAARQAQTPGPESQTIDAGGETGGAPDASDGSWHPDGYTDLNSFMGGPGGLEGAEDNVNHYGTSISPLDQAWSWLGEQGAAQGRGITDRGNDFFSGQYGTPGAKTESVRDAFGKLSHDMGAAAASYLWDHMTEGMWSLYLQMNSGEALRAMKQWLASSGFKAPAPGSSAGRDSETQQTGGFGGGAAAVAKEQGTTEEDERHRNDIAAGRPYTDESGKTWSSVSEWDAAHRGS